jgi:LPXTG-motif cell wall-anchored protein
MKKTYFKPLFFIILANFLVTLLLVPSITVAKGSQAEKEPAVNQKVEKDNKAKDRESKKSSNSTGKSYDHAQRKVNHSKEKANKNSQKKSNHSKGKAEDNKQKFNKKEAASPADKKQNQDQPKQEDVKETKANKESHQNKSTQIHLHLKNCFKSVSSVSVQWNNQWIQMTTQGNSPLYKVKDGGEYVKDEITAFKLTPESGEEEVLPVEELRVGVEAQGTINYWLESCPQPEKEALEKTTTPEKGKLVDSDTDGPDLNEENETKNSSVEKEINSHSSIFESFSEEEDSYKGVLPKTGESSPILYYVAGGLIALLGGIYLFMKRG